MDPIKELTGPVYMKKNSGKNEFNEFLTSVNTIKDLVGPVYMTADTGHKFQKSPNVLSNFPR